jgi:hypothetical protein
MTNRSSYFDEAFFWGNKQTLRRRITAVRGMGGTVGSICSEAGTCWMVFSDNRALRRRQELFSQSEGTIISVISAVLICYTPAGCCTVREIGTLQ